MTKPHYDSTGKASVVLSLQYVLDRLQWILELNEKTDAQIETKEHFRELSPDSSEEVLDEALNEFRTNSTATLGHFQKRMREVTELKGEFEASETPSEELIAKVRLLVENALLFGTASLESYPPDKELSSLNGGKGVLGVDREDIKWTEESIRVHCKALFDGFGEIPNMIWTKYPFDTPPETPV